MSLYTTSTHELLRRGNARGMTSVHAAETERHVKAVGRQSRSEEFHEASTAHKNTMWDSVRAQHISHNVGRKTSSMSPKTPKRISDN